MPASPARAASIVAFSASRFVLPAMLLMRPITAPTCSAPAASRPTTASIRRVASVASPVRCVERAMLLPISAMEAESCSAAAATVLTAFEA